MRGPTAPAVVFLVAVLLVGSALSGCFGDERDGAPGSEPGQARPSIGIQDEDAPNDAPAALPPLLPGTVYRYETSGPWALTHGFDIVVAEAGPDGYLFAATDRTGLRQDIIEGSPLFGRFSLDLNEIDPTNDEEIQRFLDLPLHDGKTWTHGDDSFTAHAAEIDVPGGKAAGFHIVGGHGKRTWTIEWGPGLFYSAAKLDVEGRGTIWEARLDAIETGATTYAWYDYTAYGATHPDEDPTTVAVPAGTDVVFFEAYGDAGTRFAATSPGLHHEVFEPEGRERWVLREVPGEAGEWRMQGVLPPDTSGTLWLVAVAWQDGKIAG